MDEKCTGVGVENVYGQLDARNRAGTIGSADQRQVGGNHYKAMPIQPWDVMQAVMTVEEFKGFLKGNVIKYSMRAGQKLGASAAEDAEKARHYKQKLQELSK